MKRIVVLTLFLVGCGKVIDEDKLESTIKAGFASRGLTLAKLDCPHGKKAKKADNFTCKGSTTDGQDLVVDVTQNDDDGNVNWLLQGSIVDPTKIKDDLAKNGLTDAKCPHAINIMTVNQKITCDVMNDGKPAKLEILLENDKGDIKWKTL